MTPTANLRKMVECTINHKYWIHAKVLDKKKIKMPALSRLYFLQFWRK
jgi:hypothetical protein